MQPWSAVPSLLLYLYRILIRVQKSANSWRTGLHRILVFWGILCCGAKPFHRQTDSTLHHTALHCTALYCTTLHCTILHYTALHCTAITWTNEWKILYHVWMDDTLIDSMRLNISSAHDFWIKMIWQRIASHCLQLIMSTVSSNSIVDRPYSTSGHVCN